jgi:hypothetical protein
MSKDKFAVLPDFSLIFLKKWRNGNFIKAQVVDIHGQNFRASVPDECAHIIRAIRVTADVIDKNYVFRGLELRMAMVAHKCRSQKRLKYLAGAMRPVCLPLALYIR